jgi:prephenate dehydrogenase
MASHKVGIIGIGLIGGSIALGLRKSGWASEIIGIDTNPEHQKKAIALGLLDRHLARGHRPSRSIYLRDSG